ncbi:sugar-specific transcriptional regulator TrmB [Lachnotalea glycerini]|jgi:HTH-type transcriptional regulator, sugar sensing transcriptional regulator|uniref:Sugar-specific transcriptional regulator TrmB n=1 Tax=Lachnotalea glycerini TaxID=1763509 RepID=A0A255IDF8_9FIRM|nr:helix-turn-helix domain-containing protein [Lachnotalea glycerini]PXV91064.1 sugar-specific transcriptional regulator TrmB [Lachnotalea glycerini]RDY30062.1 TrmB family transcriptional regulator [Lachnotalea glycerini]
MELIEQLMKYGLTRQEAIIYMTLHSDGELTGYEVAKLTGISRSNVYTALAGLVEKGVAYVLEESVSKYTPVSFQEFSSNFIHNLQETRNEIIKSLPARKEESQGYITIRGNKNILDKLRTMLLETQYRIYVAVSSEILGQYIKELNVLVEKGIKVVIIVDKPFELDGAIIYFKEKIDCQIRLICDSQKVLTGQLSNKGEATCLYSQNHNLIDVFKEMLQNEITLIQTGKTTN